MTGIMPVMSNANNANNGDAHRLSGGAHTRLADGWQVSPDGRRIKAVPLNRATKAMRDFAKRLMDYESLQSNHAEADRLLAFPVSDKLRPYLSTLMGEGGYHALLSRALKLAVSEVTWLRRAQVAADGSLEGLESVRAKLTPVELTEGRTVLLAQLLGLLTAFVGDLLTMLLVRQVWPKIPSNDLDLGTGDKSEK